jgi:two-component system KDP operon response regulator KdpE
MATVQSGARSVLIFEADDDTAETVSAALEVAGFSPTRAPSGRLYEEIQTRQPDLIIFDVSRPNGIDALRQLRATSTVPVIALNEGQARGRVEALEAGADDVVAAPVVRAELAARANALMRRIERTPQPDDRIAIRNLELFMTRRVVLLKGRRLHLTPIEYNILLTLMRNASKTVTHEELLQTVWGNAHNNDYSVLRVNISRLRQKLEENPRNPSYIVTVPGEGYVMLNASRR